MTGYTPADDGKPLSPEFAGLFPDTAAQNTGHQEQPSRTLVQEPQDSDGNRPAPHPVAAEDVGALSHDELHALDAAVHEAHDALHEQ